MAEKRRTPEDAAKEKVDLLGELRGRGVDARDMKNLDRTRSDNEVLKGMLRDLSCTKDQAQEQRELWNKR